MHIPTSPSPRSERPFLPARLVTSLLACLVFLSSCAGREPSSPSMSGGQTGSLPPAGTITIRSGLYWLNEDAPLFQAIYPAIREALGERGLEVVRAPPSQPEPPAHPYSSLGKEHPAAPRLTQASSDPSGAEAEIRVREMAARGELPKVTVKPYVIPERDQDLPASVMQIARPDTAVSGFYLSQENGLPVVDHSIGIPGRIPREMLSLDPQLAEYCLLVRFALISERMASMDRFRSFSHGDYPGSKYYVPLLAAASGPRIPGVGALGYGSSSPARPPSGRGTPGDYVRGYGTTGRDFWNRDADFRSREFARQLGEPAQYASPPQGPAGTSIRTMEPNEPFPYPLNAAPRKYGVTTPSSENAARLRRDPAGPAVYLLEMECWDLREATGRQPALIWSGRLQGPAQDETAAQALTRMAREMLAR